MNIKKQRPVLVMEQGGKKKEREIKQVMEVKNGINKTCACTLVSCDNAK